MTMTDEEIEVYLHDLAREFKLEKMRIVADRFAELRIQMKEYTLNKNIANSSTWIRMKEQGS